jgi:hypothetical protein
MSNAKNKLDALKSAFEKKASGGGDQNWKLFYSFWRMPDDATAVVRFLPDLNEDNNLGFLVENLQHELHVNGQRKKIPCPSMFGEQCPICEVSRKHYATAKEAENAGDMQAKVQAETLGKSLYRKKSYIGQVIVIESPIEHDQSQLVKLIDFGPAIFTQIQAAFKSGDLEEAPYEFKGGYNFRIKKTKSGQYASYATSNFAPKQTDLDDEIIEQLNLYDLAEYRGKKMDLATVEAYLVSHQTGQPTNANEEDKASVPAAAKHAAVSSEESASSETQQVAATTTTKTSSVLEQLRARQKAAAANTPA